MKGAAVATWIGVGIAILGACGSALASAADYGRLDGRVVALEAKQRDDADRLARALERVADELGKQGRLTARLCGATPGCKE